MDLYFRKPTEAETGEFVSEAKERYQTSSALFTVTRWHDDTSFSTFRLARGQAGTFGLIFPACPRESKSSEITVISVTLSSRSRLLPNQKSKTYGAKVSHLRRKSQSLTTQKSVTYDAKVRDLRPVIPWLTNRNPIIKPLKIKQARHLEVIPSKACKRAYKHQSKENLWKSMSNYEQVWATVSCLLTDFVSLHCDSELLSGSNQQAIVRRPHSKLSPGGPIPHNHGKDRFDVIW